MVERLSGEFNRGYTKSIQDIQEIFNYIRHDLKHHKKLLNAKMANDLLNCILENREKLRDGWNGFIRWNCVTNEFEWFDNKRQ